MRSRELLKQKIITFGGLLLRLVISYIIVIFIIEFFVDGIFNDYIATATFDSNASLYYWCVTHKAEIILVTIALIFCIIIYLCYPK